ncbi:hypothetical protein QTP88_016155 [Uroleucon formosanum]
MQTSKDDEFKFISNYQDHLTKFIQLRPLKSKTAEEVAHHLLNIFLIFGAPNILHPDNGREFVNKVISELCSMWDGVKIVHGKPRCSQTQGSIERANQDFQNILRAMMEDNDTTKWSEALPFVQFAKNTLIIKVLSKRHTKLSPQTDPENKESDENEVEKESNGKSDDNLDNQANNDEDKHSDKSDDKNQNELLSIVNVSAHQPAQPIVRPSVIQYAPPAIVPQDSIQIAPQIFVPVTPASGSNTSTDISLYDDDICMTVMNEYENEEG